MMSLLHCTSEGGTSSSPAPLSKPSKTLQTTDLGTRHQGLAVSSCRPQSLRSFVPAQASPSPRLTAALLGLEGRAFV